MPGVLVPAISACLALPACLTGGPACCHYAFLAALATHFSLLPTSFIISVPLTVHLFSCYMHTLLCLHSLSCLCLFFLLFLSCLSAVWVLPLFSLPMLSAVACSCAPLPAHAIFRTMVATPPRTTVIAHNGTWSTCTLLRLPVRCCAFRLRTGRSHMVRYRTFFSCSPPALRSAVPFPPPV